MGRVRIVALEGHQKRGYRFENLDRLSAIEKGMRFGRMDVNEHLVQELGCVGQPGE
jgi:hypothetical protein